MLPIQPDHRQPDPRSKQGSANWYPPL